ELIRASSSHENFFVFTVLSPVLMIISSFFTSTVRFNGSLFSSLSASLVIGSLDPISYTSTNCADIKRKKIKINTASRIGTRLIFSGFFILWVVLTLSLSQKKLVYLRL